MARGRGNGKMGSLEALAEARRARADAVAREAQARELAARELGLSLLETDGGEADLTVLQDVVRAVVGLGSGASLARLRTGSSG